MRIGRTRDARWLRQIGLTAVLLVVVMLSQSGMPGTPRLAAAASPARVVVLDPGHGGLETGATGNGIIERDSNLDLALRVKTILEATGVTVVLTRQSSGRALGVVDSVTLSGYSATFADLQTRIGIANAAHADAFISIHSNWLNDTSARGIEAWYDVNRPFSAESRQLGTYCIDGVSRALAAAGYSTPTRGAVNEAQLFDASGSDAPLLVLGPERDISRAELVKNGGDPAALGMLPSDAAYHTVATQMPGTLIEALYISNPIDAALLRDGLARAAIARGIADGIAQFLGQPASTFDAAPILAVGGQALVVFDGGSSDDLEAAAVGAGATGVWVQDAGGVYRLLVVGGPSFMRIAFAAAFPAGFPVPTAVMLV